MSQHNDSPEEGAGFQDLENQLAGIKPLAPSETYTRQLGRQLDAMEQDRAERKVVWVRFAPVAAAACVVLTSAFLFKDHLVRKAIDANGGSQTPAVAAAPESAPVFDDEMTRPIPRISQPVGRFVPVSEGNVLRGARDRGIFSIDGDNGTAPVHEWLLDFENSQYWYDPETGTNLHIINPVEHIIRVPVETD